MNYAVVFAGGTGQRMKNTGKPKQFLELYGKPIIIYTLEVFEKTSEVDAIVVPCLGGWEDYLAELLDKYRIKKVVKIIEGGKDTQSSKMNALRYLRPLCKDDDIVILHDAVRPLVSAELITANIRSVEQYGTAVSAVPFSETGIVSKDAHTVDDTIIRNKLFIAKAPQSFRFRDAWEAHLQGENLAPEITIDTCTIMTHLGKQLHLVSSDTDNIKITTPEDFYIFKAIVDMKENAEVWGL